MVLAPIVIGIEVVLTFLVALALCLMARKLVEALFSQLHATVGWIPWFGRVISAPIASIENKFVAVLSKAATGLQHRIGALWHSAAGLVREVGRQIEDAHGLILSLSRVIATLAPFNEVVQLYNYVRALLAAFHRTDRVHGKAITANTSGIAKLNRELNPVRVKVQALPADVAIPGAYGGLRGRVGELEGEVAHLWKWTRSHAGTVASGIGLGALAFALGRLGLGWLRCDRVGKVGRRLCGLDQSQLEHLLADTLAIVGTVSLVEFIRDAQAVEAVALDALSGFIREMPRV